MQLVSVRQNLPGFPSLIGRLKRLVEPALKTRIRFPSLIGRLKRKDALNVVLEDEFPSLIGRLKLTTKSETMAGLCCFHPS